MNMNSLIPSVDSSFGSRSDSSQSSVNSVRREHDERTVGVTESKLSQKLQSRVDFFGAVLLLVRIKRWSCSSRRHGCSGKWWSCGKHGYPPFKLDSMYQVVRVMLSLKRWRKRYLIKHATQKNDYLVMSPKQIVASVLPDKLDDTSKKPIRKRKRTVLSFGLVKIREHCGMTMEKAVANLGASSEPFPKIVLHQQQTNFPDGLAQFKGIKREEFIENATASAVKKLTIKATYKENMVKFPFTLLDGLEKLNEMVATRFQLRLGSFKLKYVDDDMILIACDTDLMLLVDDPRQPVNQPVTRLLVTHCTCLSNDA